MRWLFFPPSYKTGAVVFDGTNDYMARGADLTGQVDGKTGTISFWAKLNGGDGANLWVMDEGTNKFVIHRATTNLWTFFGKNAAGTDILRLVSTSTWAAGSGWHHILVSANLATPVAYMYINDANVEAAGSTETNDTIDKANSSNFFIGADSGAGSKLNADIADFWYSNTFIDISAAANRRKFITANLKPVDLGADGTLPGATPIAFFRHVPGAAATDFATNLGTGGNMTITGALAEAATSPSD